MRHLFTSRSAIVCLLLSLQHLTFGSAALARDTQAQAAGAANAQIVEPVGISAQISAFNESIKATTNRTNSAASSTSFAAFPLTTLIARFDGVSVDTPDLHSNFLAIVSTCPECHLLAMEVQVLGTDMVDLPTQQTVLIMLQ